MITFDEAMMLIHKEQPQASVIRQNTQNALGFVLAQDLFAPIHIPPFDNSAVDGFAVDSTSAGPSFSLQACTRAVGQEKLYLQPNHTIKIMTGAPIPEGADAVIMKEQAGEENGRLRFSERPERGQNLRYAGEDIKTGELFLRAGSLVTPQALGLLLGLGIAEIPVFRKPRVKIICTGDELVTAPEKLNFGEQYFLLGPMLKAQCQALYIHDVTYELIADDQHLTTKTVKNALDADLVLITGGISMGEYDFVHRALTENGVNEIFYKGFWRPGKPLFFGKKNQTYVFALPGNPVSAFVCFHIFVRTLLAQMGAALPPEKKSGVLVNEFSKKPDFTFFARAQVNDQQVRILPGQGSHQIFNLAQANALCQIDAKKTMVNPGDEVFFYDI